jgi:hypothetical protein
VNPGDGARSFRPAGPVSLVRPVGGGALYDRADVDGWGLRNVPVVGALTVPAHGGVVLLQRAG